MTMPVNKSQWINDELVAMTDGGEDVADEKKEFELSGEAEKISLKYLRREALELTGDTEPRTGIDALVDARYKTWFHHGDGYLFARSAGTYQNGDRRIILVADDEATYKLRIPATENGTLDVPEGIDLDDIRETKDTAFVRAACPKHVGRNWVFDEVNSRNETFIVYAGGERKVVEMDAGETVTYEHELYLRRLEGTYNVMEWSLYTDGIDGLANRVATFDTKGEAFEFMTAKMRSHDNPLIDPTWNSSDDTIDVPAVTEELFAGEIDAVADKYDMPRDELAKIVASDLGFWIPTEGSYVNEDVAIVLGTQKELSVPDAYRDAVQSVHNRAAVRITADSDWNVAEQREVYVSPRELQGR